MRIFALFLMLLIAFGLYLRHQDTVNDQLRDQQIRILQAKVNGIQLTASDKIEVAEFDGTPVLRPKTIKY